MEKYNKKTKSIWGSWWMSIRKWFYLLWLIYEVSIRFYDYSLEVYHFFTQHQKNIVSFISEPGFHILAILSSFLTFAICTIFLTVPICFVLYQFFKTTNLTNTLLEEKLKRIL